MHRDMDRNERSSTEYLLFALAFLGFGIAAAGIVLASPFLALSGLAVMLIAVSGFALSGGR